MGLPWVCIAPNVPNMLLALQVADALTPEDAFYRQRIQAIDFSVERFAVTPARLRGVGTAVREGRIGIRVGDTGPHFDAVYSHGPNRHFTLREYNFQPNDFWRATVVHEAVHAAFDLANESLPNESPPNEIDEACAYLAETIYFMAVRLRRTVTAPQTAAAIFAAAAAEVREHALHTRTGVRLTRRQIQPLIAAIQAHAGYANRPPAATPARP